MSPFYFKPSSLINRVNRKYKPVWDKLSLEDQLALAQYFLSPRSMKPVLNPTRPRMVKWYCPFALQDEFPSGHRYCINVYTGCDQKCVYCYACTHEPELARPKPDFKRLIKKDMDDLERFNIPAAPVHLSKTMDPFRPLEKRFGHMKFALEQILVSRRQFTTVTILTKDPLMPVQLGYIDLFKQLMELPADHPRHEEFNRKHHPGLVVEINLAFWEETARVAYDPCTPTIEQRIEGIRALNEAKIPLVLRIDPLFPRSPVGEEPVKTLADYGLPETQTLQDLEHLVALAKEMHARHIVYSVARIVRARRRPFSQVMQKLKNVYEVVAAPEELVRRGRSWRLPQNIAESQVVRPFLEICRRKAITAKYCKQNLIETP